jgi:ferredoxin/flavodoxin
MLSEIYYFSGTGNSLAVARDLAAKLKAVLIPIATLMDEVNVTIDPDVAGIVFPVYHSGLPAILHDFIEKTLFASETYVFGVCTYGASGPGGALRYLKAMLRPHGGQLAAGFAVKMPYNYVTTTGALYETSFEDKLKMYEGWLNKREVILGAVKKRQKGPFETGPRALGTVTAEGIAIPQGYPGGDSPGLVSPAGLAGETRRTIWRKLPLMDGHFYRNDDCINCGICSEICPVGNIDMGPNGPEWLHDCEQCFACLQWCPNGSLQFGSNTEGGKRYHHPDVVISDMIGQRKPVQQSCGGVV